MSTKSVPLKEAGEPREPAPEGRERLARLFLEHNGSLVACLTARLRSAQEAREVAQEAFMRLLQLPWTGSPQRLVREYLFKTAMHLCIDRLRRETVRRDVEARGWPAQETVRMDDPLEQLAAREDAQALLGFLAELPERSRQVFELHRLEGLSQQEVGRRLSLSDRMVRRHVSYALVYCRLRLDGLTAAETTRKVQL